MKLKIKITGPKVHGVGYRYFLLKHALIIGLRGFHAENRLDNSNQIVNILLEGDEERINRFAKLVECSVPEHADISNVSCEEYDGDVPRAGDYAQLCTVVQVDKALPAILDIRDGIRALLESQRELVAGQRDLSAGQKELVASQKELVVGQKELADGQRLMIEEIRGLREDLQPGLAMQIRALQVGYQSHKGTPGHALKGRTTRSLCIQFGQKCF